MAAMSEETRDGFTIANPLLRGCSKPVSACGGLAFLMTFAPLFHRTGPERAETPSMA